MERRNLILGALLAGGAILVMTALFWPKSDEELILAQLNSLAEAVGFSEPIENPMFFGATLADRLEPLVTEQVQVSIPEVHGTVPRDRGQLALASAMALSRYGSLSVSLSSINIQLSAGGARANAEARVIATEGGQLKSDSRTVHFELIKDSGDYQVSSVRVGAVDSAAGD